MTLPPSATDRLLSIYLVLSQYPVLSSRIRDLMRRELFSRGFLDPQDFDQEVIRKAIQSQEREGLQRPQIEEPADVWERRKALVREQLTDFYFSHHLSFELIEELIEEVLNERGVTSREALYEFNPEVAPQELLFNQGMMIENMPPAERQPLQARLREIKVVLIRNMISDQLRYINIARNWFTISDLAEIRRHKIGHGRIGGKAAGMLLAARILKESPNEDIRNNLRTPESYYMGSDLLYTFISVNNLIHWNDQKYKPEDEMRRDFPKIVADFVAGEFPPSIVQRLETLLTTVGNQPLIVRSSSLLEDNFGTAFAGKYDSIFLPNQGKLEENLKALTQAIARIYASTLNPTALLYRRSRGLQDYDERMALLIQTVEGNRYGDYYLPDISGVAFSHNQYRWSPQIRQEDGFIRLVWGLGTRAVDRVGNDYPRLVALSHPTLRPSNTVKSIRRYSQQYVDLIDLKDNSLKTLPVQQVLSGDYPPLRYLAQIDQEGYFRSIRSRLVDAKPSQLIMTFEDLLRRTPFAERMRYLLTVLEKEYESPVDVEFIADIIEDNGKPEVKISLIQCRPLSYMKEENKVDLPRNIPQDQVLFSSSIMVTGGWLEEINYVLFVPPESYFSLPTQSARNKLERAIGKLNAALSNESFICVGPGRWGTSNPDLGVHVDYADIFNSKALVELSGEGIGPAPEPSLGTHFFQDLLEGQIFPLATYIGEDDFNHEFFYDTPNRLAEWIEVESSLFDRLRLIKVSDYKANHHLELVMNGEEERAIAFLSESARGRDGRLQ
ncbi:MAG: PEP/pyruvate-binding domain-containing protein [Anaerolineaceae bacterium]|nr:PEP/pyruvate-binding domain-containing protein [Anaerolineaceae bacterium]